MAGAAPSVHYIASHMQRRAGHPVVAIHAKHTGYLDAAFGVLVRNTVSPC